MASKSFLALALSVATATAQTFVPLRFAGVNIAGFDFGCGTDGTCNITQACPPLTQLGCADGLGQMQHFVENDGYNVFRLPVGWQYLTYSQMTGTQFYNYNMLVNACLSTGAYCEIDIHSYARYDGEIIGQGRPRNEVFAELWYSIADYWKYENRVVFGVMNEPHDIPDIVTWAGSVQAAVTAIRSTGANSQMILLRTLFCEYETVTLIPTSTLVASPIERKFVMPVFCFSMSMRGHRRRPRRVPAYLLDHQHPRGHSIAPAVPPHAHRAW
ncbi:glycoside hydrolase superfamily [Boletus edulis BED1]|uniref:cellulase n=1 Tax=Boletus edulis BED1 TaxID=1328754 RepID=A0AAD4GAZ5_BOLED|nr:glycoside hydrolase superfamily [Boletus edulis BED1]